MDFLPKHCTFVFTILIFPQLHLYFLSYYNYDYSHWRFKLRDVANPHIYSTTLKLFFYCDMNATNYMSQSRWLAAWCLVRVAGGCLMALPSFFSPLRIVPLSIHQMVSLFPVCPPPCRLSTAASAKRPSTTDRPCCPNRLRCTERWGRRAAHTCKPNTQSYPHISQLQINGGGCHVTVANLKYILIFIVYFQKNIYFIIPCLLSQ